MSEANEILNFMGFIEDQIVSISGDHGEYHHPQFDECLSDNIDIGMLKVIYKQLLAAEEDISNLPELLECNECGDTGDDLMPYEDGAYCPECLSDPEIAASL